jgi:hypothetical protein
MSDVSYTPTAQRVSDRAGASELADAKGNSAPLKAFESALLNVKAASPATPAAATAPPAATAQARSGERSARGNAARDGGKDSTAAKTDDGGPRPGASSTTTAIASSVQGGVASETSAKTAGQKSKPPGTASKSAGDSGGAANARETGASSTAGGAVDGAPAGALADDTDALAPTTALSHALADGTAPDVKAALQSTLEGFANGRVPDAIKASLGQDGTLVSAEIADLLDNITLIAKDILDKGPLSDLDFANLDDLFWVSNWFDLFNQPTTTNDPLSHSVSSAMAMPIDIFYTRALLVPLVDAERAAAPGLVNRRAVRANTEPTPGAESIRDRPAQ